ncbi:MAG: glutamate--cysteine ligase [Propionicimonas sp.]|uniref:glutamate--cysteine ligase n=1 Tax=Propionicimonas sp. TaxID=1955623 RepID=UPI003D14622F
MRVDFAPSEQSSVGIEWELALVDLASGELTPAAPQLIEACGGGEDAPVRKEYLQEMVELVSGVHRVVGDAVADIAASLDLARREASGLGVGLVGAGTHPFSRASAQPRFSGERYDVVAERNAWWGRQMAICGTHVHVGVDHRDKALPITSALARFYPYLLAVTCSSPYWEGEDTGYASQRTMLFQQLPTNGLPWPMSGWAEFEEYAEDLARSGMITVPGEIRWDVRPSPRFGTVENRTGDSVPTLAELGCVAALTQCFAEHASRSLAADATYESLPPWLVRENKWRAARYGMDAEVITPRRQRPVPLREGLAQWLERLEPVARDLGCEAELRFASDLAERGASYERQRAAGEPRAALDLLLAETGRATPFDR